jgi:glycosyltransferase involved in cell wall biosynthesis
MTGTARVAEEILRAWDDRLAREPALGDRFRFVVLRPADRIRDLSLTHIAQEDVHGLGGKLWELFDLPWAARSGVLVNFANISPFIHRRSVVYLHDAQMFLYANSYPLKERLTHWPLMALGGLTARRVITISDFSSRMLQKFRLASKRKITVINNGADHILRESDPSALEAFGLSSRGYALMFGSGFAYKNNQLVYEAYKRLGAKAPPLAIIGRADERKRFEDVLDGSAANIMLLKDVSDGALRTLYSNALVFLAPSRTEGYPMTPLEALNCGCPSITTPEGSMVEVLGDAVDYAGADDPDGWAKLIAAYAEDPGRRERVVARGAHLVASKTWENSARRLLEEIEKIMV